MHGHNDSSPSPATTMFKSPYPELHLHLAGLREINGNIDLRPVLTSRDDAEELAAELERELGRRHVVTAVWRLNHQDLEASEIVGWSFSENPV